jgi:acetylornithine aminotransferase/acetylornithine/N-succinyldiaminopimelate aminotransferase
MSTSTRDLYERYVVPTYRRFDLMLARGKGAEVFDESGKRYLDFGAGIAVTSIGHGHPRVIAKLSEQVTQLVHTSNLYYTRPQGELAERLVRLTGAPGKIFFCNSGAEANEALYKLARKYGNETVGAPRYRILTFLNSFHGRTLGGIAATGQDKVKHGFEPAVDGFFAVPFNDIPALETAVATPGLAAILLEPVQGESGIRPATSEFLRAARALCDAHGLLLFFDEVQCGLGRTGHWCGWHAVAADVQPDGISWAKGIAGGFPLGAVWISDRAVSRLDGSRVPLCDLLGAGSHGTTFGGTPLVCAGANEVLAVIEEEGCLENAQRLGAYAKGALTSLGSPWIEEVRGVGLMLGIQLTDRYATEAGIPQDTVPSIATVERLHTAGLLTVPSGTHCIRLLPPLNVTREVIDEAVTILAGLLCP